MTTSEQVSVASDSELSDQAIEALASLLVDVAEQDQQQEANNRRGAG